MIFIGVDWAEAHHDVHVQDEAGKRLGGGRLPEGVDGIARFHELAAAHAQDPGEVAIGIETDRGLFVAALAATDNNIVVSEDHYPAGGLGEAIGSALLEAGATPNLAHLAVHELSSSGTPDQLLDAAGISAPHIAAAARALVRS